MSAGDFIDVLADHGVGRVVYTDTDRDGMLTGPDFGGLCALAERSSLELILSGGVSQLADLERLKELALPTVVGVITGRALYEHAFTLGEALAVFAT